MKADLLIALSDVEGKKLIHGVRTAFKFIKGCKNSSSQGAFMLDFFFSQKVHMLHVFCGHISAQSSGKAVFFLRFNYFS